MNLQLWRQHNTMHDFPIIRCLLGFVLLYFGSFVGQALSEEIKTLTSAFAKNQRTVKIGRCSFRRREKSKCIRGVLLLLLLPRMPLQLRLLLWQGRLYSKPLLIPYLLNTSSHFRPHMHDHVYWCLRHIFTFHYFYGLTSKNMHLPMRTTTPTPSPAVAAATGG